MKKSIIFIMLALVVISVSVVSAGENATDLDAANVDGEVILSDVPADDANGTVVEDVKADSKISGQYTKGYEKFTTEIKVKLTSNGTALPSKKVIINLGGNNYTRTTDASGEALLKIKLSKGTYKASYYFLGDNATNPSQASSKVKIDSPKTTVLKLADENINYRQGSKSVFIVRLLTDAGSPVKKQNVTFRVDGKTYVARTSSKGYAQIFLSLNKGKHKVHYSFKANKPYLSSKGSTKIKVKEAMGKGDGYWMWASGMYSVSLKALKDSGTKQIFLHSYAIYSYGRAAVTSWIAQAHKYGMKVHLWVQVFYDGDWVRPMKSDGTPNYSYMKKRVATVVNYAKISGVDGVHLDYVRFGGTAHLYKDSAKAVNYFVKKTCIEVRKVRPNCIISAAIMPEPDMMLYYYGQDIPTISKYLDVIIPMAYKGNYAKSTPWIGDVTKFFVKQSNGAQVWTGLQSYYSDDNVKRLPNSLLMKDAKTAKNAGALGIVLFRIGITNLLNFNKV